MHKRLNSGEINRIFLSANLSRQSTKTLSRFRTEVVISDLTSPPAAPLLNKERLKNIPVPLLIKERLGEVLSLEQNHGFHYGFGLDR
jgi:hypothetical protein